ncbi:ALP1-like protein isoform X1 [Tanacetum coccineum]
MFMVFRECLEVLIVCTGNGKIVQCHGKVNTVEVIKKYPTIMLEVVASQDLWIWHAFYGMAGANMSVVDWKHVYSNPARSLQTVWIDRCQTQRRKAKELRDKDTHISLQQNLMNHIWREVEDASEED